MIVALDVIVIAALLMAGLGLAVVVFWFLYGVWLTRRERRLAARKGLYRELVEGLASRERALLEPALRQLGTLHDFEALEAVLEEQARSVTARPAWLLDAYDRLGLVDKYARRLVTSRKWRERAFAAELLGRVGNAKAVPALLSTVRATKTEDSDVREIALRALARIADPRAVEPLVAALRESEGWLAPRIADVLVRHGELAVDPMIEFLETGGRHPARAWAADVLGQVRAQRAFPALVRALGDLDDEVRAKAAGALGRLADRRALTYLLDHLLSDPAPFVRARIAGALGQFNDPEVIDRLVRALGDAAWWVRMRSVEALEQIGPVAEGPLLLALEDADPEIRIRSAVALERLGVPARLVEMIETGDRAPQAQETLVKFAVAGARELLAEQLLHRAPAVRLAVIEAIRRGARRDLAPELTGAATGDADGAVRAGAFDALRGLGLAEAVPAAVGALVDEDETVRSAALRLVGELGDRSAAERIRARTSDSEWAVRAAAAQALGRLRADADADLARLLRDPVPAVRAAAALAAADAVRRELAPAVAERLGDSDAAVRRAAAEALGHLGDRAALPALERTFRDAPPELRETIAEAVGRLDPDALPNLVDLLLASGDVAGKLGVIRVLRNSGALPAGGVDVLSALTADPEPLVRADALEALGLLDDGRAQPLAARAAARTAARTAARAEAGLGDPDERVRVSAVNAVLHRRIEALGPRLVALLGEDPSPLVRERAALGVGALRVPGGEGVLLAACHRDEPLAVRAAAVLALGGYESESMVGQVLAMSDETEVRLELQERIRTDAEYRGLARALRGSRHVELRALAAGSRAEMETSLAEGMRSSLDVRERIRLVLGLVAFQGEQSRGALLQVVRGDPSPEVRAAALGALGGLLEGEQSRSALLDVARRALGDPSTAVRHAAVELFRRLPAEQALPGLIQALRADDDPAVLQAVAAQAEAAFDAFVDLALGVDLSGREAVALTLVARWIHHPRLAALLLPLGRGAAPEVRQALAALWAERPDLADARGLAALAADPVVGVRRAAARAAAAAGEHHLLVGLAADPDAGLRAEAARLLQPATDVAVPAALHDDPAEEVRAAAFVVRLLRGELVARPADVRREAAAAAVHESARVEDLRAVARTAPDQRQRLAAALALALVDDATAREVAAHDPVPAIRARVAGMLNGHGEPDGGEDRPA